MRLYHRTTAANARTIVDTRHWESEEQGYVYFSTHPDEAIAGYGDTVVAIDIDDSKISDYLDDEFPDGEQHFRIPAEQIAGLTASCYTGEGDS